MGRRRCLIPRPQAQANRMANTDSGRIRAARDFQTDMVTTTSATTSRGRPSGAALGTGRNDCSCHGERRWRRAGVCCAGILPKRRPVGTSHAMARSLRLWSNLLRLLAATATRDSSLIATKTVVALAKMLSHLEAYSASNFIPPWATPIWPLAPVRLANSSPSIFPASKSCQAPRISVTSRPVSRTNSTR